MRRVVLQSYVPKPRVQTSKFLETQNPEHCNLNSFGSIMKPAQKPRIQALLCSEPRCALLCSEPCYAWLCSELCRLRGALDSCSSMDEKSTERCREALKRWQTEIPWLTITPRGLGCRVCMDCVTSLKKSGLASGCYIPGKYLTKRTFASHTESNKVHKAAVGPGITEEPMPLPQSPAASRRGSSSTSLGSTGKSSHADSPKRNGPSTFLAHVSAAYSVCQRGWSSSVFAEMLDGNRLLSADVADGHNGPQALSELREIILAEICQDAKDEMAGSPAFCVSMDEKDAKAVLLLTFLNVKAEQRITMPIAYKMLPGLEAADVMGVVQEAGHRRRGQGCKIPNFLRRKGKV